MKKIFLHIGIVVAALAVTASCSNDEAEQNVPVQPDKPDGEGRMTMNVITRTVDNDYTSEEGIGLFAQHYNGDVKSDLVASGNYVNNVEVKQYVSGWGLTTPVCWFDEKTLTDFYAYAPYRKDISNSRSMEISVPDDQSSDESLASAPFLWGCSLAQSPTSENVPVTLHNILSKVVIKVKLNGNAISDIKAGDLAVYVNKMKCIANVDLQTGLLTLKDETASIKTHNNGDFTFTCIVMPQQTGFVNILRIDWKNETYELQGSQTFESQKIHTLNVTLTKTAADGLDVGIGGWDIDDEDYGGTVE